jgi:hypothetical protein
MEKSQFKKKEYWYHTANLENTKMQPVRQKRCQKIKKIYMYAEKVSRNMGILGIKKQNQRMATLLDS